MNAFAPKIDRVYGLLHLKTFLDDVVDGVPAEEILYPGGRPQPPGQPSDFLPEFFGSAAEAVEFVMRWVRDMCDDDTAARDELQEGLEAWDYLTDTIAIDFTNIEDRWRRLPRVLIPDHLARAGLLDLLRNAVDAHLVGAHAAAVVMCRAVCEKVLKEYYLDEEEYLDTAVRLTERCWL